MNTLRCSRFIYLTMRSHLKRILVILAIPCIPLISTATSSKGAPLDTGVAVLLILFFLSSFLSIQTFYACDKVPQLFMVLPQSRVDFVRAVYLNFMLLCTLDLTVGLIAALVFHLQRISDSGFLFLLGLLFLVFVLMISVELPFAFKIGYAKLQIVFVGVVFLATSLPTAILQVTKGESLFQLVQRHVVQLDNPGLFAGFIVAGLVALAVSYGLSTSIYQHRDV